MVLKKVPCKYGEATYESLANLISKNSHITSIELSGDYYGKDADHDVSLTLHQLFKHCTSHVPPLRLKHLGLDHCLMRLDEVTLPHLKNLTSLNITFLEDPNFMGDKWQTEDRIRRQKFGSTPEDIWNILRTAQIYLEAITVDDVPPSFIDYMSSYGGLKKGLRKLHLSPKKWETHALSDEIANRFFAEAFMIHAPYLEDLRITPQYEGLWCFGPRNTELLSKCINLRKVRLSVLLANIKQENGQASSNGNALVCIFHHHL